MLPVELLVEIALKSIEAYRNMLALPPVARYAKRHRRMIINNFTIVAILPDRTEYRVNNRLHREDRPAIEYANGIKEWYQNGKLHREDGPAYIHPDGDKFWYQDDKLHRDSLPAVKFLNGTKKWYQWGKKHRDNDLPAVIKACGTWKWFREDVLYRKMKSTIL